MSWLTKAFGKKKVWKLFRKMIRSIDPELYDEIRDLVLDAEDTVAVVLGKDKRRWVLDRLESGVKGWLANIFLEFVVGELIENGKPKYLNLLNK